MRKSTFEKWDTSPVRFFNEHVYSKPRVKRKSKLVVNGKLIPFYLTPNRVNKLSIVNTLKDKFGTVIDGVNTLKTPFISSKEITHYNGSQFYLCLVGDKVYLKIISDNKPFNDVFWNIGDIVSVMKSKNSEKSITFELVKDLIIDGKLQVKFNVSKIKDHGTLWRISLNDSKVKQNIKTLPKVKNHKMIDEDFFSDF